MSFLARRLLTRFSFLLIYGTVDRCSGRSLANIIMTIDEALQAIKGSLECLVTLRGFVCAGCPRGEPEQVLGYSQDMEDDGSA